MGLKGVWTQRHGLTLVQFMHLKAERACEQIVAEQTRAMYEAIEREPQLLAELQCEHDDYLSDIEARITKGWKPSADDWRAIRAHLQSFAARRKAIVDPYGIGELVKEASKPKPDSILDRYSWRRFTWR